MWCCKSKYGYQDYLFIYIYNFIACTLFGMSFMNRIFIGLSGTEATSRKKERELGLGIFEFAEQLLNRART